MKYIVLHCSDSTFGDASLITAWHQARGWRTIGYHYVINNGFPKSNKTYIASADGRVEAGRPLDTDDFIDAPEVGAHVKNHNSESIGICLIGKGTYTKKQLIALAELLKQLLTTHKAVVKIANVVGHYELDATKTCPKIHMPELRAWLKQVLTTDNIPPLKNFI
jgi:hypothetical protein